jgi:cytochrome P450
MREPRVATRHAEVQSILADPRFEVPPAPPGARGIAWLRGAVSRLANGDHHARRQAQADSLIGSIDANRIRVHARALTEAALTATEGGRLDVMPLARAVPVAVLAGAFGTGDENVPEFAVT